MKVREIMTRNVLTLEPECPVLEAVMIFGRRVRYRNLPVVKNGLFRGLLTPFDLLGMEKETRQTTVASVMKTSVKTISPDAEALDAAELMLSRGLGCLPVTDGEGRLVGIITGSDFLRIAVACMRSEQAGVDTLMETSDPRSGG